MTQSMTQDCRACGTDAAPAGKYCRACWTPAPAAGRGQPREGRSIAAGLIRRLMRGPRLNRRGLRPVG